MGISVGRNGIYWNRVWVGRFKGVAEIGANNRTFGIKFDDGLSFAVEANSDPNSFDLFIFSAQGEEIYRYPSITSEDLPSHIKIMIGNKWNG